MMAAPYHAARVRRGRRFNKAKRSVHRDQGESLSCASHTGRTHVPCRRNCALLNNKKKTVLKLPAATSARGARYWLGHWLHWWPWSVGAGRFPLRPTHSKTGSVELQRLPGRFFTALPRNAPRFRMNRHD